ncbi:MAG: hypothetical protein Ct9H300mP20_17820 [Gammaproteobacteria bacterium]|nr:MAG: hypothetical protein Ct9H300mP20_17820 [Gammaproteobacteria bacterium]
MGPDNYYLNSLLFDGTVDGTAHSTFLFSGYELYIDNYRYAEKQRLVNVKKETYRFLQGFRGSTGNWDGENSFCKFKRATSDDSQGIECLITFKSSLFMTPPESSLQPF